MKSSLLSRPPLASVGSIKSSQRIDWAAQTGSLPPFDYRRRTARSVRGYLARQPGGVQRADNGADAAACNRVRHHAHVVECLEHQDVRQSFRTATTQCQADPWPCAPGTAGQRQQRSGDTERQELAARVSGVWVGDALT